MSIIIVAAINGLPCFIIFISVIPTQMYSSYTCSFQPIMDFASFSGTISSHVMPSK